MPDILLTKTILRDNLGFEVHDMGDYWQCEKEDFVLIQPKFIIELDAELPFVFGYKTTVSKTISFTHLHHLQEVYKVMQQKELVWKP